MKPKAAVLRGSGLAPERLELAKVVEVQSQAGFIRLDRLPDGRWRLTYSADALWGGVDLLDAITLERDE